MDRPDQDARLDTGVDDRVGVDLGAELDPRQETGAGAHVDDELAVAQRLDHLLQDGLEPAGLRHE